MLPPLTLMIIDDSAFDREFFVEAVGAMDGNHKCIQAVNAVEGLKYLYHAAQLPDYIFLDLNMPMIDGRECLAAIKREKRLKDIPVIIYSTADYRDNKDLTMSLGAAYFLSKPWDLNALPGAIILAIEKVNALYASRLPVPQSGQTENFVRTGTH